MPAKFQRQDSTTDQLNDVRKWANEQGLTFSISWLDSWESDYLMKIDYLNYALLLGKATEMGCYDAADAMSRRYEASKNF